VVSTFFFFLGVVPDMLSSEEHNGISLNVADILKFPASFSSHANLLKDISHTLDSKFEHYGQYIYFFDK
jgi:hypothetical protein